MEMWSSFSRRVVMATCLSGLMAAPAASFADTVSVASGTTIGVSLEPDVAPLFYNGGLDNYLEFYGAGVVSGEGGAIAPVGTVSVVGQGPGAITIDWGTDVQLRDALGGVLNAKNISLSVADQRVYADISFNLPDAEPAVFTHVGIFTLTDLAGNLDGVPLDQVSSLASGPGQLSLTATVFANLEAVNEIVTSLGGVAVPTDGSVSFKVGTLAIGVSAVPEPATWATMGLGLAGLMALGARRRRAIS